MSACTFYILYEASSVPSFIFTLVNLRRRRESEEENAASRVKQLEFTQDFEMCIYRAAQRRINKSTVNVTKSSSHDVLHVAVTP